VFIEFIFRWVGLVSLFKYARTHSPQKKGNREVREDDSLAELLLTDAAIL
jgi:hypothetical protein